MNYKLLLAGKNRAMIDDFFTLMADRFEAMTSSIRYKDLQQHLKYFEPDAFVVCMNNEPEEITSLMFHFKTKFLDKQRIPLIIIGTPEECGDFNKIAIDIADLTLLRPINAITIEASICQFMDDLKRRLAEEEAEKEAKKAAEEAKKAAEEAKALEEKNAQLAAFGLSTSKKRIMVIDDDTVMLRMIREHLRDHYEVVIVTSGTLALKYLETKTADLILLDYEMPEESGPEVLQKLHDNPNTNKIPVLFLTGVTEKSKIAKALVLKPQGYLLKPIDRNKLFAAIEKQLGKE